MDDTTDTLTRPETGSVGRRLRRDPRSNFPIDFSLGRGRWVHTLDELLTAEVLFRLGL